MTARQFIAAKRLGRWSAWESSHPELAHDGDSAATALRRLLGAIGVDFRTVEAAADQHGEEQHFVVKHALCPDCGGKGQYIGLNHVEKCKACGGAGVV